LNSKKTEAIKHAAVGKRIFQLKGISVLKNHRANTHSTINTMQTQNKAGTLPLIKTERSPISPMAMMSMGKK
jgi:hypothetical protein